MQTPLFFSRPRPARKPLATPLCSLSRAPHDHRARGHAAPLRRRDGLEPLCWAWQPHGAFLDHRWLPAPSVHAAHELRGGHRTEQLCAAHAAGAAGAATAAVEAAALEDSEGARGTGAVCEVAGLLKKRKKRRRELEEEAAAGEYVPLDPTNWRAKAVAPQGPLG